MDGLIIWKSSLLFIFTMTFFWIIFYTFQPGFLDSQDKLDPDDGTRGYSGSDALLSDRGRTTVFLYSLIPAGVAVFFYILYSYYFNRPVIIKCSPKAKKLGQCKIIKK